MLLPYDSNNKDKPINETNIFRLTGLKVADALKLTGVSGYIDVKKIKSKHYKIRGEYPIAQVTVSINNIKVLAGNIHCEKLFIYNKEIRIEPAGEGYGCKIFESQFEEAKIKGFRYLVCWAYGNKATLPEYCGYITWAKFGYLMIGPKSVEKLKSRLKIAIDRNPSLKYLENKTVNELVVDPEGYKFWYDNGFDWLGRFDLQSLKSIEIFKAYKASSRKKQN